MTIMRIEDGHKGLQAQTERCFQRYLDNEYPPNRVVTTL